MIWLTWAKNQRQHIIKSIDLLLQTSDIVSLINFSLLTPSQMLTPSLMKIKQTLQFYHLKITKKLYIWTENGAKKHIPKTGYWKHLPKGIATNQSIQTKITDWTTTILLHFSLNPENFYFDFSFWPNSTFGLWIKCNLIKSQCHTVNIRTINNSFIISKFQL